MKIKLQVNGRQYVLKVKANSLLVTVLREDLGLTGTRVGCDTSQCGACTVHMNGRAIKACSLLAVQADETNILTIEGIGTETSLHPMQEAFRDCHALQCGFCTPGMIMQAIDLVEHSERLDSAEIRRGIEGNICRCTGYHNIVRAIAQAAGSKMIESVDAAAREEALQETASLREDSR